MSKNDPNLGVSSNNLSAIARVSPNAKRKIVGIPEQYRDGFQMLRESFLQTDGAVQHLARWWDSLGDEVRGVMMLLAGLDFENSSADRQWSQLSVDQRSAVLAEGRKMARRMMPVYSKF